MAYNVMQNRECKINPSMVLVLIIVLQVMFIIILGFQKYGYHVDELFSYGLANHTSGPFLFQTSNGYLCDSENSIFNSWISGNVFSDYLVVEPGQQFNYWAAYYNQANDAHPPMYFFILHTVCSLMPGIFSKWAGIGINIVFFILSQIVLYYLSTMLLKSKISALACCLLWGFGVGAVNMVLFIRMYGMLTFCVLLITCIHFRMILTKDRTAVYLFVIFLISIFGLLTHFYFLIYAFFLAIVFLFILIVNRKFRLCVLYSAVMLSSVGVFMLIFPAVITQLSIGFRGTEAVNNLVTGNLFNNFYMFVSAILQELCGLFFFDIKVVSWLFSIAYYLLLAFIVFILIKTSFFRKDCGKTLKYSDIIVSFKKHFNFVKIFTVRPPLLYLLIIEVLFIIIIARISPQMYEFSDRYIFCTFPLISILFIAFINRIIHKVPFLRKEPVYALLFIVVILLFSSQIMLPKNYLYPKHDDHAEMKEILKDVDCIYVTPEDYLIHSNIIEFSECHQVLATRRSDLIDNINLINSIDPSHKVILLIDDRESIQSIIDFMITETKFHNVEFLIDAKNYYSYKIYQLE